MTDNSIHIFTAGKEGGVYEFKESIPFERIGEIRVDSRNNSVFVIRIQGKHDELLECFRR